MRLLSRISTLTWLILDGLTNVCGRRLCSVFSTLCLPYLKVLHHSSSGATCFSKLFYTIQVLERHASPSCFLSLCRIYNGWTPSAVRNRLHLISRFCLVEHVTLIKWCSIWSTYSIVNYRSCYLHGSYLSIRLTIFFLIFFIIRTQE